MVRFVLGVGLVLLVCHEANAERLVLGHSVIYREATEDYLFRIRFNYDPDFSTLVPRDPPSTRIDPETVAGFAIYDGPDIIAQVLSTDVPETGLLSVYDVRDRENPLLIAQPEFDLNERVFETTIPRSTLAEFAPDPLFHYLPGVTRTNVGSWPNHGPATLYQVQLNVPEPSSVLVATSALAPMALCARRKRARFSRRFKA
jgi:hypothetical protein